MTNLTNEKRWIATVIYVYASAFTILNLGEVYAYTVVLLCMASCLLWVEWGFFKRTKGRKVHFASSLLFAVFLMGYTFAVAEFNTSLNGYFTEKNPSIVDKGRVILSVTKQMPQHREMKTLKKNGVLYFHTKESRQVIPEMDALLTEQQSLWDQWLGETQLPLAIQFLNNDLIVNEKIARAAYQPLNSTIYINSDDESLAYIVKHEYTHYRINGYAKDRVGGEERIPQWFNEGLADTIATGESIIYLETEGLEETVSFGDLNENDEFHHHKKVGKDPYLQSFTVVRNLVNEHGFQQVVNLTKAKNQREFYIQLEQLTGMDKHQVQQTYSKKMP